MSIVACCRLILGVFFFSEQVVLQSPVSKWCLKEKAKCILCCRETDPLVAVKQIQK